MAQRLTDLVVDEASLVDFPANAEARVLLWKRDATAKASPADSDVHVPVPVAAMKLVDCKGGYAVEDAAGKRVSGPHKSKADALASMKKSAEAPMAKATTTGEAKTDDLDEGDVNADELKAGSGTVTNDKKKGKNTPDDLTDGRTVPLGPGDNGKATPAVLKQLIEADQALADSIAKAGAKISGARLKRLKDAHQTMSDIIREQDPTYPGGETMTDVEQREAAEKKATEEAAQKAMPAALAAALEAKGKGKGKKAGDAEDAADGGDDEAAEGDAMKKRDLAIAKLDPELQAILKGADERVAKAEERIKKAEARAESSEQIAKEERDLRVTMELTNVAKKDLAGLPGTTDEKVAKLRKLYAGLSKKDADEMVDDMRKSALAVRESAAFKEIGAESGDGVGGTAEAQLDRLAKARQTEVNKSATAGGAITYPQAYDLVLKDNPGLYDQYRREQSERARGGH